MNRKTLLISILTLFSLGAFSQPTITLTAFATGFNSGISEIVNAGDSRLFVVQQLGYISIVDASGTVNPRRFLNIHNKVTPVNYSFGNEQGLLGLAFSPNYASDGNFYVNYTNKTGIGNSVIARYHVSSDPDSADVASEEILLTIHQPYDNHNGGCLRFGADGYLYCGFGDGGLFGDPQNRAQNTDSLQGKILRIDVSSGTGYTIPPSNPFVVSGGAPEIWAYGIRNPWRFSFDRLTNDLWIGDVGQDIWEEIDVQGAGAAGGINYGWRCYEGNTSYNSAGCSGIGSYTPPVYTYSHASINGCSITGGYVYRGNAYPAMQGYYFYADFCNGKIYSLSPTYTSALAVSMPLQYFVTFGENNDGELFVGSQYNGTIYSIAQNTTSLNELPSILTNFSAYPMPTKGEFVCEFDLQKPTASTLTVFDLAGRKLLSQNEELVSGSNKINFDLNNLSSGIYFLKIQTEDGFVTKKIELVH